MRGLAIDSRAFESLTWVGSPVYSDPQGNRSALASTPAYLGPSGLPVTRLDGVPGVAVGWGAFMSARRAATAPTLPIGTRVRIAFWARSSFPTSIQITTDDAANTIPIPGGWALSFTTDWQRWVSAPIVVSSHAWDTTQRVRFVLGTSGTDWAEASDCILIYQL